MSGGPRNVSGGNANVLNSPLPMSRNISTDDANSIPANGNVNVNANPSTSIGTRFNGNGNGNGNGNVDPYVSNDYHPLSLANHAIINALRRDEACPDADLYKRIASTTTSFASNASNGSNGNGSNGNVSNGSNGNTSKAQGDAGPGHLYHTLDERNDDADERNKNSNINNNINININNNINRMNGYHNTPNATNGYHMNGHAQYNVNGHSNDQSNGNGNANMPIGIQTPTTPTTPATTAAGTSSSFQIPPTDVYHSLEHTQSIPLPPYLTNLVKQTKLSSLMGILPEGNMAWVSVDDALYLWEYGSVEHHTAATSTGGTGMTTSMSMSMMNVNGGGGGGGGGRNKEDFVCFKVPSGQCVVSAGIVKPKSGVFKDKVEWCIVVTTPEEAIICALTRESIDGSTYTDSHLKLIPTRYLIPTDSVPILSICGTEDGRIFMGGYDGCLYEMSYEGYVSSSSTSTSASASGTTTTASSSFGTWYEENEEEYNTSSSSYSNIATTIATGSKRAISTLLFGPTNNINNNLHHDQKPRKCRKVNHTSIAPSIVSAFVPGFVLRAASAVLGSNPNIMGGSIIKLVLDKDRKTLYGLTSKGFIHAFDLDSTNTTTGGSGSGSGGSGISGGSGNNNPPRLACSMNVSKSVSRYLDSVAHGRMYPPSISSTTDSTISAINFPGGGSVAQAGVGGMDGARSILKIADTEMMRKKLTRTTTTSNNSSNSSNKRKNIHNAGNISGAADGCLQPISIHIVPPSESKFLTLVAISTTGLRYYISVLPDSGTSTYGSSTVKPGRRFTLCYIRAPPPLLLGSGNDFVIDKRNANNNGMIGGGSGEKGVEPWLQGRNGVLDFHANSACYASGVTMLALDGEKDESNSDKVGDSVLVMTPDYTSAAAATATQYDNSRGDTNLSSLQFADSQQIIGGGSGKGVSEVVSQPMRRKGSNKLSATVMAGGHIWDIAVRKSQSTDFYPSSSILNLYFHSTTPSDPILESDIVSVFIPPSLQHHRRTNAAATSSGTTSQQPAQTSFDAATAATQKQQQQRIITPDLKSFTGGIATLALDIFGSVLFNKPTSSRLMNTTRELGQVPVYVIAERSGCSQYGFSSSAMEEYSYGRRITSKSGGRRGIKSQRLKPTLLNPTPVPLAEMSMQHLVMKARKQCLVALNSGGLHCFSHISPIEKLQSTLIKSNSSNIRRDENVKSFFTKYGRAEGSALCLSIAIHDEANDKLVRVAIQAALGFSNRPSLIPKPSGVDQGTTMFGDVTTWNNLPEHEGFTFKSSSLHDGLLALTSRLLRPIWCKPAVVVTEGKIISPKRHGQRPRIIPAKVELLLDEVSLKHVQQPLIALQKLMKEVFARAVTVVPGVKARQAVGDNVMETDDSNTHLGYSNLMTNAVQYQAQASVQSQNFRPAQASQKELSSLAELYEERNIHAIYRTLSRTVQLLTLMSHLRRAHLTPELPEVDFGYLHGLTYSQLVTSKVAQDRIDTVLTNLFTDNSSFASIDRRNDPTDNSSSVESSNLSSQLASQCYLFFSIGSRLTHLGFSKAHAAMSQHPNTASRNEITNAASAHLRKAATHWYNPTLIAGRFNLGDQQVSNVSFDDLAANAHDAGSPLARAAFVLMELQDVIGVVDVCLICSRNFGGELSVSGDESGSSYPGQADGLSGSMMPWERGLYHRQSADKAEKIDTAGSPHNSSAIVVANSGADAAKICAKRTCYAVLFYYLNSLLNSTVDFHQNNHLVEKMLSIATESQDLIFLKELYGYLASTGHMDTLLRLDTPSVESWLKNINRDPDLLWRYYVVHKMHWMAGELMWKRGSGPIELNLKLEERIECLTRAANSYSNCLDDYSGDQLSLRRRLTERNSMPPSRDEVNRFIVQINEQIDVAKLQNRVLSAIMSSQNADKLDKEKSQILSYSLVNVSVLYNNFAAPLGLYDLCLSIFQTCRCDDSATIITLWRSILCEELLPCRTGSKNVQLNLNSLQRGSMMEEERIVITDSDVTHEAGGSLMLFEDGEWIPSIKHRIIALGKELHGKGADFVFPLDFIAKQLEGLYCVHKEVSSKPAESWTLDTLIEAGVSFPALVEAYSAIVVAEDTDLSNPTTKLAQFSCISNVLRKWLSSAAVFGAKGESSRMQLSRYTPSLLQQIDAYKLSLQSLLGYNSQDVSNLIGLFSEIEECLRRNENMNLL